MPFIADHNGEAVNSFELSDDAFLALRGEPLLCPCCDSTMHIAHSSTGLKASHFVHEVQNGECSTYCMSEEHLAAQALVRRAINQTEPWTGHVEYRGENWRGDVVATHPVTDDMISFEVQFSGIDATEVLDRTERHLNSGVKRVIWLCARDYPWMSIVPSVSLGLSSPWDYKEEIDVEYKGLPTPARRDLEPFSWHTVSLSSFVSAVLTKELLARKENKVASYLGRHRQIVDSDEWLFQTRHEVTQRVNEKAVREIQESDTRRRSNKEQYLQDKETVVQGITAVHPDLEFNDSFGASVAFGAVANLGEGRVIAHPVWSRVNPKTTPNLFDSSRVVVVTTRRAKDKLTEKYPGKINVCTVGEFSQLDSLWRRNARRGRFLG
jgi:hypothetical protein